MNYSFTLKMHKYTQLSESVNTINHIHNKKHVRVKAQIFDLYVYSFCGIGKLAKKVIFNQQ